MISTSSMASSINDPTMDGVNPPYRISKAAINMYIHTLSLRLKEKNITVLALDPGRVKTDMGGADAPTDATEVAEYVRGLVNNPELQTGGFYAQGKLRAR
ncbi:MAG: SDR family NAD(P)-dependent oxidoreductase [bacterium]